MKIQFAPRSRLSAASFCLVISLLVLGPDAAYCQVAQRQSSATNDSTRLPSFDIAAIHLHKPVPSERSHIIESNGRFITVNVGLKAIMRWAFHVPASRIVGGPAWTSTEPFDIEAKSENGLDVQPKYDSSAAQREKRSMVVSLLTDRFHLVTHMETRELPVYALVRAKNGPTFLSAPAKGTTVNQSRGRLQIEGGENTLTVFTESLAEILDRVVVDKTGLEGKYSLSLKWTPDDAVATSDQAPPSIYTALQEQLGLRLEAEKAPVEVLVIDRVEMPTDN